MRDPKSGAYILPRECSALIRYALTHIMFILPEGVGCCFAKKKIFTNVQLYRCHNIIKHF